MKVTYYGQSCFLLEINNKKILFDPYISPNELAKDIDVDKIEADYILVSHGHGDHMHDLLSIAERTQATVVSSFEITEWVKMKGIHKIHPMNIGGKWSFDFGSVKMVFAAHSNSLPDGSYGGVAAGFIIKAANRIIYYSGDTGLNQEMKLIGELMKPDLAFLPIGDNFTMDVDDAIIASKYIQCDHIVGMHYDTFGFIKIDKEEAKKKFNDAKLGLTLLNIGETRNL